MKKLILGQVNGGEYAQVTLDDNRIIVSTDFYDLIDSNMTADACSYLRHSGSGMSIELGKHKFSKGDKLPNNFMLRTTKAERKLLDEAYDGDCLSSCSACGLYHDTDSYGYNTAWVLVDCEIFCKECVSSEQLLTKVTEASEAFEAKSIEGMEAPKGFKELKTLFCDSSGFGSENEPALTQEQATNAIQDILDAQGEVYAALTGCGQFQVYLTLYVKRPIRKRA